MFMEPRRDVISLTAAHNAGQVTDELGERDFQKEQVLLVDVLENNRRLIGDVVAGRITEASLGISSDEADNSRLADDACRQFRPKGAMPNRRNLRDAEDASTFYEVEVLKAGGPYLVLTKDAQVKDDKKEIHTTGMSIYRATFPEPLQKLWDARMEEIKAMRDRRSIHPHKDVPALTLTSVPPTTPKPAPQPIVPVEASVLPPKPSESMVKRAAKFVTRNAGASLEAFLSSQHDTHWR